MMTKDKTDDKADKKVKLTNTKAKEASNKPDDLGGDDKLTSLQTTAVSPGEMTAMKGGKPSPLAASDETVSQIATEDFQRALDADRSIAGRLTRTGYVLNENQITGERWVGLSVQRDPDADAATKARTRVTNIAEIRPFRGLTVKPTNGEPFAVSEEFDKDATPADWFAVLNGEGKPFLEGV
jgi:hypothetical protein